MLRRNPDEKTKKKHSKGYKSKLVKMIIFLSNCFLLIIIIKSTKIIVLSLFILKMSSKIVGVLVIKVTLFNIYNRINATKKNKFEIG